MLLPCHIFPILCVCTFACSPYNTIRATLGSSYLGLYQKIENLINVALAICFII